MDWDQLHPSRQIKCGPREVPPKELCHRVGRAGILFRDGSSPGIETAGLWCAASPGPTCRPIIFPISLSSPLALWLVLSSHICQVVAIGPPSDLVPQFSAPPNACLCKILQSLPHHTNFPALCIPSPELTTQCHYTVLSTSCHSYYAICIQLCCKNVSLLSSSLLCTDCSPTVIHAAVLERCLATSTSSWQAHPLRSFCNDTFFTNFSHSHNNTGNAHTSCTDLVVSFPACHVLPA